MAILLVGCGGTGKAVIHHARTILDELGGMKDALYSVNIDTDSAPEGAAFDRHEYIPISNYNVGDLSKNHSANVRDWWYTDDYHPNYNVTKGAGHLRTYSRIGMYFHGGAVRERLDKIQGDLGGQSVDVVIAGSLAGGTGSGILLDVAYMLSDLIRRPKNIYGVVFSPQAVIQGLRHAGNEAELDVINGLAALTELETYMRREPRLYYQFKIRTNNAAQQNLQHPGLEPFSSVFLIEDRNAAGAPMKDMNSYTTLAARGVSLLALMSEAEQALVDATDLQHGTGLENILRNMRTAGPAAETLERRNYGALGYSRFFFPADRVEKYCVQRLLKGVVSDISSHVDGSYDVKQAVDEFVARKKLREVDGADQLLTALREKLKGAASKSPTGEARIAIPETDAGLVNALREDLKHGSGEEEAVLKRWDASVESSLKATDLDAWSQTFLAEVGAELRKEVDGLILSAHPKWKQARAYVQEMRATLNRQLTDVNEVEAKWVGDRTTDFLNGAKARVLNEIEAIRGSGGLFGVFKKREIEEQIEGRRGDLARAWCDRFRHRFLDAVLPKVRDVYSGLIAKCDELHARLDHVMKLADAIDDETSVSALLPPGPTVRSAVPFEVAVCGWEAAVLRMIYEPNLGDTAGTCAKTVGIQLWADFDELPNRPKKHVATLIDGAARATVSEILSKISLQDAFEKEFACLWRYGVPGVAAPLGEVLGGSDYRRLNTLQKALESIYSFAALDEANAACAGTTDRAAAEASAKKLLIKERMRKVLPYAAPFWTPKGHTKAGMPEENRYLFLNNTANAGLVDQDIRALFGGNANPMDLRSPTEMFCLTTNTITPLHNFSNVYALLKEEIARRGRIEKCRKKSSIECHVDKIGCCDRRFVENAEMAEASIFPEEMLVSAEAADAGLVFALAEALGYIVHDPDQRANYKLAFTPPPEVKDIAKGDILDRGLVEAVEFLVEHPELATALKKKCEKHIHDLREQKNLGAAVEAIRRHKAVLEDARRKVAGKTLKELNRQYNALIKFVVENLDSRAFDND